MAHRTVLLVLCAAQAALFIDVATITVCLPSIRTTFDLAPQALQWVVTSYALTFAGFLLIGGRLADTYGPGRVLVVGLATFAGASAGVGLAPTFLSLCACRAVEGVGAALLAPAALAMTNATFVREADRVVAFGYYGTALAGGFTVGALASGLLATAQWRAAMFINVPVSLAVLALLAGGLPRAVRTRDQPLSLAQATLATAAAGGIVYVAAQANVLGPGSWPVLAAGAAAIVLLTSFVVVNVRSCAPLVPPMLLGRTRRTAMVAATLSAATGGSAQYVATTYLQVARGESAFTTGAAIGALGVAAIVAGSVAPRTLRGIGRARALASGLGIEAAGALWLALATRGRGPAFVGAGMAIVGFGLVLATVAYTTTALANVRPGRDGVMTGLLRGSEQLGGAVGLALIIGLSGADLGIAAYLAATLSLLAAVSAPLRA
jgi:MFS family permease